MAEGYDLIECLDFLNPSDMEYTDWIQVGMALKCEGYGFEVWDEWSRRDVMRYKGNGAMERKWSGFESAGIDGFVVKGGTIVQMAKDSGWVPPVYDMGTALGWDDDVKDDGRIIDPSYIERASVKEPWGSREQWHGWRELVTYLETLFSPEEIVGYVTEAWQKEEKWLPADKGACTRTAGELISALNKYQDDLGSALWGEPHPEAGAWIRFNPLDGQGAKNDNVAEFRYALVECDDMDVGKQKAIIEELELPVAALLHSGGKSIHAVVRVGAENLVDYKKRVEYLYSICKKNGLKVDTQNKNPSRLSRMPGVWRGDKKQWLIATNIGKETWAEWVEWIEAANDDLPDPEGLDSAWDNMPTLASPLISGVLRQGHKMLISGLSKAGKSFDLIELCVNVAEGGTWHGWQCAQGRVLYVNLELDPASCLHRFKDVYEALMLPPENIGNIDIWNLRGKAVPMDKLAPKLIRRAAKKNYIAVVLDPIYKINTGDENNASEMGKFCNQLDRVCTELGCAVIYCHHHSKGAQGHKRSADRASGSGVFARDPDAILDLIELDVPGAVRQERENAAVVNACAEFMLSNGFAMPEYVGADDLLSACRAVLSAHEGAVSALLNEVYEARRKARAITAWRIEGTLREFPGFEPVNVWFEYPIHKIDTVGVLKDVQPEGEAFSNKGYDRRKKTPEQRKEERKASIEEAFDACNVDGRVSVKEMAEFLGVTEQTVRNRLKDSGDFWVDNGEIGRK